MIKFADTLLSYIFMTRVKTTLVGTNRPEKPNTQWQRENSLSKIRTKADLYLEWNTFSNQP